MLLVGDTIPISSNVYIRSMPLALPRQKKQTRLGYSVTPESLFKCLHELLLVFQSYALVLADQWADRIKQC